MVKEHFVSFHFKSTIHAQIKNDAPRSVSMDVRIVRDQSNYEKNRDTMCGDEVSKNNNTGRLER